MPEKEYEFGSATKDRQGPPGGGPPPGPGGPGGGAPGEKAKDAGKALRELVGYIKAYLPAVCIALLLGGVSAVFSVIGPDKISEITNLIVKGLVGSIDLSAIAKLCVLLLILYGLSWIFGYVQSFILATVTQRVCRYHSCYEKWGYY